jgi:hypothetical protein
MFGINTVERTELSGKPVRGNEKEGNECTTAD